MAEQSIKVVANNKKAYHDYFVEDKFEAGIELAGTEVKSIRRGNVNLKDSYCIVKDGEIHVHGMHISPYEQGNIFNKDPLRPRRLLMHKREILRLFGKMKQDGYAIVPLSLYFKGPRVKLEIMRLFGKMKQDGYAIVPLSLYFKGPRVKLEIGLCKGKKLYDKRDAAAAKDAKREMDRAMKTRNR